MKQGEKQLEKIVDLLIKWYQENGRKLPWRENKNPYTIWISEIMLQQTKIEAVKNYYERFMQQIPDIKTLASIEEEKLLKLWEGLGYYNRARNLKKAAIKMVEEYEAKMPTTYEELKQLPGIGEYTAGAIASIAYQEKVTAVDGNVLRVISRIIGSKKDVLLPTTKKEITQRLEKVIPEEVGDFNEGLMELGEMVCIPNGEPLCNKCPVKQYCIANQENLTMDIPVRIKKTTRKIEDRTIFLLQYQNKIAIQKRPEKGLLANLYEFPNVLGDKEIEEIDEILQNWNLSKIEIQELGNHKHIFSHIEWNMRGYQIKVKNQSMEFEWVEKEKLESQYAIPTAFHYFKKKIIKE